MKKIITYFTIFTFTFSLSSCVTTDQSGRPNASKSAESGAFFGALGGALTGFFATGKLDGAVKGAVIGAAVGGLTGFIVGKERERQYKTAEQIYKERPQLAMRSARNQQPAIVNFTPMVFDYREQPTRYIKNGQTVQLGMKYEIHIPKYRENQQCTVVEYNTLIASNGHSIDTPGLRRKMNRSCGAIEAAIPVEIPKNLPDGKYIHYASVTIDGHKYEKKRPVQVTKVNGEKIIYAMN